MSQKDPVTLPLEKQSESSATIVVRKESSSSTRPLIHLWSHQFLSNWFFTWTFPIITLSRSAEANDSSNLEKLFQFRLRDGESARINVDALTNAWKMELELEKE
jgi:hypothetical protein